MTNQPNRELAVFNAARRLLASERAAYLDEACAGDAALRQRIEELLQASDEAGDFLKNPAAVPPSGTSRLPANKPGDRIGRYKLLQQIGEGGCGVVYMAEQEQPVQRRVALKVIKLGMDTKSVIARFEAERQALALMDHPNIAKVLDAGATDTGRPFFVMELVRGIKITDYCDQNDLSTKERLDLFIQVCHAIQHAHQKGIIHRDIKPSNILVTMNDGVPLPKVIDFGIAKATHGKLTDQTVFTAFEQFIGTPAYMSPEQAEMSALDIDTRSDIYSLGVLLYELLTGQTPFDAEKLLKVGLDEIRRTIREQEPARPSTRLSTMLEGELTVTANHRQVEPPKLIHLVRGDLDWIVMKALDKNRTRRYETANGLAADIERHLKNEPVMACPPGNLYKFQKLVRRNKLAFIAASVVIAALIIGLGASTWMFVQEKKAHQQTIAAEREQNRLRLQAEAEKQTAQAEAVKSRQVAQFFQESLRGMGNSQDAEKLYENMITQARRNLGDSNVVLGDLHHDFGAFLLYQESKPGAAAEQYLQALPIRRANTNEEQLTWTLRELGDALLGIGKPKDAEPYLRESLALYRKLHQQEDIHGTARTAERLADALYQQHKLPEAEAFYRHALLSYSKTQAADGEGYTRTFDSLVQTLRSENKLAEAEALMNEALARKQKSSSPPNQR